MEFETLNDNEVICLWPTTIMKQLLPGAEQVNRLLANFSNKKSNGGWIEHDDEAASWLRAQLQHGVKRYFEYSGFSGDGRVRISTTFEDHGFGAYRGLGNQPGALLSGRYGVTLPEDLAPGPRRDDLHPGYISFYDPRSAMNMNAINQDPYLNYHRSIALKPGLLLMWPSYLSFFIHPNLSRTPRVSVAFDIYKEDGTA